MNAEIKPGYKMTEVGVIPEDWKIVDYAHIGAVIDGDRGENYPNVSELMNYGDCLFLDANNVTKNGFRFVECRFISADKDKKLNKGKLNKFDVVLTTRGTVGNFAYFDEHVPFANIRINSGMVILRNILSVVTNIYHYLILRSPIIASQIGRISFGSAQPQLTVKGISNLKIPFPPSISEQRSIAAVLSDGNFLIESLEQLIVKKRQIKQGVMQDLLTPQSSWNQCKISDLMTIMHGKSQHNVLDMNGAYPILATGGQIGTANQFLYDKPSVLIGRKGTIDRPQYMTKPFWSVDTLFYTVIHEPYIPKYIFYQFCLIDWRKYNEASGVPSLSARTIGQIELKVPSVAEQEKINNILSNMDSEIEILETKLSKIKQIKQGMMQNLLTGKIRLV